MKEENKQKLLDYVRAEIEAAENYFDAVRAPDILEKYNIYNADPKYYRQLFQRLGTVSDLVSKDIAATVEWALPSLLRIFTGNKDIISISPIGPEDEEAAEINQKLLNFQLSVLNNAFSVFYRWFKDALIVSLSVLKCWWVDDARTRNEIVVVDDQQLLALRQNPNIQIKQVRPIEFDISIPVFEVSYSALVYYRGYPKIQPIPYWEFLYSPKCFDIHNTPFACHRKEVTVDFLRRKAKSGIFAQGPVQEAINNAYNKGDYVNAFKYEIQPRVSLYESPDKQGTPAAPVTLYECYLDYDIDGDGLLEPVIVTLAEDQILRIEKNTLGAKPFFGLSPILEPFEPEGKSYSDSISDIQHTKTALIRQILLNVGQSNNPRWKVQMGKGVVLQDLIDNKEILRTNDMNALEPIKPIPLAPWTFSFLEYLEVLKENVSGVTRYSQGLDSSSLNKTATGISKIMEASQQRLELIARIFAETGIRQLFRFMVGLNQRFVRQEQVIRVAGKPMRITPDDLQGEFDFVVESSALFGGEEKQVVAAKEMLGLAPVLQQKGMMDDRQFYNLVKKYFEVMGLQAIDKYIKQPNGGEHGLVGSQAGNSGTVKEGINSQAAEGNAGAVFQ